MVLDLARGAETPRLNLLRQLQQNSEFLQKHRQDIIDILENMKVCSFYETEKTPCATRVRFSSRPRHLQLGEVLIYLSD